MAQLVMLGITTGSGTTASAMAYSSVLFDLLRSSAKEGEFTQSRLAGQIFILLSLTTLVIGSIN